MTRSQWRAKKRVRAGGKRAVPTRARFLEVPDAALLDRLLGEVGVGERLLRMGRLQTLRGWSPYALTELGGLTDDQATRLVASMQVGYRMMTARQREAEEAAGDFDVPRWAAQTLGHLPHEELWIIGLDSDAHVRGTQRVAMGGRNGVATDVPTVLRQVIEIGASQFVLAHNHPNDDPEPSPEDRQFTAALWRGSLAIEAPLRDHLIITPSGQFRCLWPEDCAATEERGT